MLLFSQQLSPFAAQKGSAWWRNSHTSLPAEDLVLVVLGAGMRSRKTPFAGLLLRTRGAWQSG